MADPKKHTFTYQPGEVIFSEGDSGDAMFFIQKGEGRIHRKAGRQDTTLALLKRGDCFGEMALLESQPRCAGATAVTEANLLVLSHDSFEALIPSTPAVAMAVLRKMSERLRQADQHIRTLLMGNGTARVASVLLMMLQHATPAKPAELDFADTRTRLAGLSGTSEEAAEQVLRTLDHSGIIHIERPHIHVGSTDNLRRFVEYLELRDRLGA